MVECPGLTGKPAGLSEASHRHLTCTSSPLKGALIAANCGSAGNGKQREGCMRPPEARCAGDGHAQPLDYLAPELHAEAVSESPLLS